VAFVVEVQRPQDVTLASAAKLAALSPSPRPVPEAPVEMIAGFGMWPPQQKNDIAEAVKTAKNQSVGRMVVDTGLTGLNRAYRHPEQYYKIIAWAAKETRQQGLRTAFYFPAFELRREGNLKTKAELLTLRYSWAQVTLSGRPFYKTRFSKHEFWNKEGDQVLWLCPNTPWREVFIERMVGAVRRGIEILFIDVPYYQATESHITCRCEFCRAKYKKDTGRDVPKKRASIDRRWLAWRRQVLADFFSDLRRSIKKENSRARLVVEEYPAYIEGATRSTGIDIGHIGEQVDIFAHEYSAKQFDKKPYSRQDRLELAATLNLYRGLDYPRPTWVLSYAHDPAGSRVSAAYHLCYDASFWETKAPEMNDTTVGSAWRKQLFSWFAKHRQVFGSSRPLAQTAVLYSPASRDISDLHFKALRQVTIRLTQSRIPHRVLSTRDLDQLGDYSTLILPAITALSPADTARIRSSKIRLLALGQVSSRLEAQSTTVVDLPSKLGSTPVRVNGDQVVVNLIQRKDEIQVRLANLTDTPAEVIVNLRLRQVKRVTRLSLLDEESPVVFNESEGSLRIPVNVKDLTVLRLRMK
jgi:hypothetical protein